MGRKSSFGRRKATSLPVANAFSLESLEPRLFLSADPVSAAVQAADQPNDGGTVVAMVAEPEKPAGAMAEGGTSSDQTQQGAFDIDLADADADAVQAAVFGPAAPESADIAVVLGEPADGKGEAAVALDLDALAACVVIKDGLLDLSSLFDDVTLVVSDSGEISIGFSSYTLLDDGTIVFGQESPWFTATGAERLLGGSGADTFLFVGDDLSGLTIDGGAGDDELVMLGVDTAWTISGLDSGAVRGASFAAIENLTGGIGNRDTFVLTASGGLSGGAGRQ